MKRKISHCHKLVANVAMECAAQMYENLMGDNLMYEVWKKRHPGLSAKGLLEAFVKKNWSTCIPIARATLAGMLNDPHLDSEYKESIVEALSLDSSLMRGRADPKTVLGEVTNG